MHANPVLSIVIPTCNRSVFLDRCLEVHIPLARQHNVQIFIVDNASTDATEEVVKNRTKEYQLINYKRNSTNIGAEDNVVLAIKYPRTEYVWILADNYQIPCEGIEYVLNILSKIDKKYDAIVLNIANNNKHTCTRDFSDRNELLVSLGAIMTCISCLVLDRKLIDNADFIRYKNSRFVQTGIVFEAIAKENFNIHFAHSIGMATFIDFSDNENSWSKTPDVFDIACERWVNFVYSLPFSYSYDTKTKCIKDLTRVSTIFSFRHLLKIRSTNVLNYMTYKKYLRYFHLTINLPKLLILIIAITPMIIPRFVYYVNNKIKRSI